MKNYDQPEIILILIKTSDIMTLSLEENDPIVDPVEPASSSWNGVIEQLK